MGSSGSSWWSDLRRLPRATADVLRPRDLPLHAAALTFYSALSIVPVLLVTGRAAAALAGPDRVRALAGSLEDALPQALGAGPVARALVESGIDLDLVAVLIATLPASVYGEGLRRACSSLVGIPPGRWIAWRGRLATLPLVVVAPALLLGVLSVTPLLADLLAGGAGSTVLGTYVALNVCWIAVSVVLAWVFVAVVPHATPVRHAVVGAFATGAFVAGFLQGFVLFLSLPIDLGLPFGGLVGVGGVVAVLLWLWVLHAVVLVGWVATRTWQDVRSSGAGQVPKDQTERQR